MLHFYLNNVIIFMYVKMSSILVIGKIMEMVKSNLILIDIRLSVNSVVMFLKIYF